MKCYFSKICVLFSLSFFIFTAFPTISVHAQTLAGEGYRFDTESGLLTLTSAAGSTGWKDVDTGIDRSHIRSVMVENTVTELGEYAFFRCEYLSSVIFEEGSVLNLIDKDAFNQCTSLTEIIIPKSVTALGEGAFYQCSALTTVEFEQDSLLGFIDTSAFAFCGNLKGIIIPNSVTGFGIRVFQNCTSLASLEFEENSLLSNIQSSSFRGCSALTEVTIPKSVQVLHADVFSDCYNLTSVTFEEGSLLNRVFNYVFYNCYALTDIILPAGVLSFGGDEVFGECHNLSFVYFEGNYHSELEPAFSQIAAKKYYKPGTSGWDGINATPAYTLSGIITATDLPEGFSTVVTLKNEAGNTLHTIRTVSDGEYVFPVTEGSYEMMVDNRDYLVAMIEDIAVFDADLVDYNLNVVRRKTGDANRDNSVNRDDLIYIMQNYNQPSYYAAVDVFYDGKIDFNDLALVRNSQYYGR